MPRIVPLPPAQGLSAKLDRLASSLADALLDEDVALPMKIAGLKVLSDYRNKRTDGEAGSAYQRYQAAMLTSDDGA